MARGASSRRWRMASCWAGESKENQWVTLAVVGGGTSVQRWKLSMPGRLKSISPWATMLRERMRSAVAVPSGNRSSLAPGRESGLDCRTRERPSHAYSAQPTVTPSMSKLPAAVTTRRPAGRQEAVKMRTTSWTPNATSGTQRKVPQPTWLPATGKAWSACGTRRSASHARAGWVRSSPLSGRTNSQAKPRPKHSANLGALNGPPRPQ